MCSTSDILNDSKEPRRRRFDEKKIDYANTDYKNPDFSNTKNFHKLKFLYFDVLEWTYISSAYQFYQASKKQLKM